MLWARLLSEVSEMVDSQRSEGSFRLDLVRRHIAQVTSGEMRPISPG